MFIYIYGLEDPETHEIRYVGKAKNPKARYRQHLYGHDLSNNHKQNWINSLLEKGLRPELIVLEETDDKHWEVREKYWIKFGLDNDWPLVNISCGGACYPTPNIKSYNWSEIIKNYLTKEELEKFKLLNENEQFTICQKTAIKMMDYSWISIKERGGIPEILYSQECEYHAGRDMARNLIASY